MLREVGGKQERKQLRSRRRHSVQLDRTEPEGRDQRESCRHYSCHPRNSTKDSAFSRKDVCPALSETATLLQAEGTAQILSVQKTYQA